MLVALSTSAYAQRKAIANTAKSVIQVPNYAATHPGATIWYHATSDMVLCTHRGAPYLSKLQASSHTGGHFFLNNKPADPIQALIGQLKFNGPVHTTCQIICNVMASAAKAGIASLSVNG
jgi:hypothetical protein